MRVFKIFLIVFFSLVGIVGATIGIMFATGYFDDDRLPPDEIYFEQSVYNEEANFSMTITSNSLNTEEGVSSSMREVTLSFRDADTYEAEGKISNGIITVPKTVRLGEAFTVEVVQEINDEISALEGEDTYWNVGGQSTLVAQSVYQGARQVEAQVNIDVPVYSIDLLVGDSLDDIASGNTSQNFNVGASYVAQAKFIPAESQYLYGDSSTYKTVLIDLRRTADSVFATAGTEQGTYRIFTADQQVASLELVARTFRTGSANAEALNLVSALTGEARRTELLRILSSSSNTVEDSATISQSVQRVTHYTVGNVSGEFEFNRSQRVYANYGDSSFGIQIFSNETLLNYKLEDVGIVAKIIQPDGSAAYPSSSTDVVISGGDWFNPVDADGDPVRAITPNFVVENSGRSYWDIAVQVEGARVVFDVYIRDDGDLEDSVTASNYPLQTAIWSTTNSVRSVITWNDESDVNLKYVDDTPVVRDEFNLLQNLTRNHSSYNVVKYIAYSNTYDVNTLIHNTIAENDSHINFGDPVLSSLLTNATSRCEIDGDILTTGEGTGSFYVLAMVIQTNYNGAPIYDSNNDYIIDSVVVDYATGSSVQPLIVNITKTLKEVSVGEFAATGAKNVVDGTRYILEGAQRVAGEPYSVDKNGDVYDFDKARLDPTPTTYTKLDGSTGTIEYTPAIEFGDTFGLTLSISSEEESILREAWNSGELRFEVYDYDSNQLSSAITYSAPSWTSDNSGTEFTITFTADANLTQDGYYYIVLVYDKKAEIVYEETVVEKLSVYDGKAYDFEFVYGSDNTSLATTADNRLTTTTNVEVNEEYDVVTAITTTYSFDQTPIDNVTEGGRYRTKVYDKYHKDISAEIYATQDGGRQNEEGNNYELVYSIENSSSSRTTALEKTLYVTQSQGNYELYGVRFYGDSSERPTTSIPSSSNIEITTNGGDINLTGADSGDSLIIFYLAVDGGEAEYYRVPAEFVNFSFGTYSAELADFFTISNVAEETTKTITFLKGSGVEYSLTVDANIIGIDDGAVRLNLTINPYYVLNSYSNSSSLGYTQTPSGRKVNVYAGTGSVGDRASTTKVIENMIILEFERSVSASAFTVPTDFEVINLNSNHITQEGSSNFIGLLYTGSYALGDIDNVEISTGTNSYDFSITLALYGIPNVTFELGDGYTNEGNTYVKTEPIYWTDENGIQVFDIENDSSPLVTFSERLTTTGGLALTAFTATVSNPVFNMTGGLLTRAQEIEGEQVVTVTISYIVGEDSEVILNLVLTILPDIVMGDASTTLLANENGDEPRQAFASYEGLGLMLTWGKTYSLEDILATFKKSGESGAPLTETDFELTISKGSESLTLAQAGDTTIELNNVLGLSSLVSLDFAELTITQKSADGSHIASQTFDVFLLPVEYPFVKYDESKWAGVNSDLKTLFSRAELESQDVYIELDGGTENEVFLNNFDNVATDYGLYYTTGYTYSIENADPTETDNSKFASYDSNTGTIRTETVGSDTYIYLVARASSGGPEIFRVRFKIIANTELNTYYPYIIDADSAPDRAGEYVSTESGAVTIDFSEEYTASVPNWLETGVAEPYARTRVMLQTINHDKVDGVRYEYALSKVTFSGNDYTSANDTMSFASMKGSVLTIKNMSNYFVVYVSATAWMGTTNPRQIGEAVEYVIYVNSNTSNNYRLKESATSTEDWLDKHSSVTVSAGKKTLYLSSGTNAVVLVNEVGGLTSVVKNELRVYVYNVSLGTQVASDITLDQDALTVTLNKGIVSDYEVTLMLYTRYGVLAEVPLTFESAVSHEIKEEYGNETDGYYIYAGKTLTASKIATINGAKLASATMTITREDGSEVVSDVASYTFPKSSVTNTYHVTVACALTGFADPYIYSFDLTVYRNVHSTYTSQTNPMPCGDNIKGGADAKFTLYDIIAKEGEEPTGDNSALFEFATAPDLTTDFSYEILTGSSAVAGGVVTFTGDQITVPTASVAQNTAVLIRIDYKLDDTNNYSAYIYFVVEPNYTLTTNYYSGLSAEHVYLASDGSFSFSFDDPQIFVSQDRVTTNNNNEITIRYDGANYANAVTVTPDDDTIDRYSIGTEWEVSWAAEAGANYSQATLTFTIFVDDFIAGEYTMILYKEASSVFTAEVDNFETVYENGRESFVVPGGGAGGANVFSNAYQKLTFVVKGDIAETIGSADYIELTAKNGVTISGNTRITSQDAGSTMTVYVYGAGAALTAGDGGNISTYINIASYANANPTTPISTLNLEDISTLGSVAFSHKVVVSYRGQNVPFETYKDYIKNVTVNEDETTTEDLVDFKISTTSENEQATTFSLFGTTTDTSALVDSFFTYSYQATLDFKVANSYSGYIEERLVGNNITNVLDTFGITRYNDAEFDQTYFINNTDVTLSSNVVLVVTKDFDLSSLTGEPTAWKDSLVNADNTLKPYVNFVNLTFNADSAVTTLGQNDFAYVAAQQTTEGRTYNFQYTLTGAGNSGNIVIFSVTFDYDGWSDTQYVAVDLSTNYSIVLRNGTTTTSQTNSQAEPLILQYNTSSTPALLPSVALSSGAGSNNYIYVTRNNLTGSTNVAHTAFTNYEIENEELRKYISIAINNSGITLVQNGTNVLNYSDITGAIRFYDSAGYEFRYYVRLVGATDTKVEFDSIWDARTGEMGEIIYEGSKVIFADRDAVLGDSTASNYSRAVLNYVEENSLSDIDYIILVSNLNINSIARYNEALSTGDNAYLYDEGLVSTVTNGDSNATANSFEFDFAVLGGNIYSSSGTIVQPLSFSFNSGSSTGELVTINFEINLTQRYVLSISSNNYLLNGESYELLDFISVRDAKYSNGTLGSVTLTNSYKIENTSGEALTQLTFTRADSDSVVIALGESLENGDYTFADQGSSLYSQIASALEQGYACQEVTITQDKLITMLMIERTGESVTFELVNSAGAITITALLDTTGQKTWHLSDSATIQGNAHDYIFVDGSLNSSELETIYGITGTDGVSIDTYVEEVNDFTNRLTTSRPAEFTPILSINDQNVNFGEKTLTYRVSTNPYSFTNSGNVYIDHSGFTQNVDGNYYEVEFEDWTRGLNVYDYNGANLGSMLSYKESLNFQINEDQTSAGAATLDETFKITTGSAFTMNTSSIIINVYAKAYGYDAEAGAEVEVGEVLLGSITVILRDTLISAPAQGTYTVEQRDSATTRSAFVSFLNQTYYYISDLTAPGNVYGFEQDTGGAYTYTLRALLKNVEGISLNASNLYIELSILEDPAERAGNSLTLDLVLNSTGISQGEEIKISFPSDSSTDASPTITVNSTSTLTSFEPTAEQEDELKESIGQNQYYLSDGNLVLNINVGSLTNTAYASLYQASRIDLLVTSSGTSQAETASITLSNGLSVGDVAIAQTTIYRRNRPVYQILGSEYVLATGLSGENNTPYEATLSYIDIGSGNYQWVIDDEGELNTALVPTANDSSNSNYSFQETKALGYASSTEITADQNEEISLNISQVFDDTNAEDTYTTTTVSYNLSNFTESYNVAGVSDHGITAQARDINWVLYKKADTSVEVYLISLKNASLNNSFAITTNNARLLSLEGQDYYFRVQEAPATLDCISSVIFESDYISSPNFSIVDLSQSSGTARYFHTEQTAGDSLVSVSLNSAIETTSASFTPIQNVNFEAGFSWGYTNWAEGSEEYAYSVVTQGEEKTYSFLTIKAYGSLFEFGANPADRTIGDVAPASGESQADKNFFIPLDAGVYTITSETTSVSINNTVTQSLSLQEAFGESFDPSATFVVTPNSSYESFSSSSASAGDVIRFTYTDASSTYGTYTAYGEIVNISTDGSWFSFEDVSSAVSEAVGAGVNFATNPISLEVFGSGTYTLAVLNDRVYGIMVFGSSESTRYVYNRSTNDVNIGSIFGRTPSASEVFVLIASSSVESIEDDLAYSNGRVAVFNALSSQNATSFTYVNYTTSENSNVYVFAAEPAFSGRTSTISFTDEINRTWGFYKITRGSDFSQYVYVIRGATDATVMSFTLSSFEVTQNVAYTYSIQKLDFEVDKSTGRTFSAPSGGSLADKRPNTATYQLTKTTLTGATTIGFLKVKEKILDELDTGFCLIAALPAGFSDVGTIYIRDYVKNAIFSMSMGRIYSITEVGASSSTTDYYSTSRGDIDISTLGYTYSENTNTYFTITTLVTTPVGGEGEWIYLATSPAENFDYIIGFVHATQSEQNRDVYTFDETLPEGLLYIDFNASVVENIQNGYYTIRSSDNASQVECRVTDGTLDLEDVFGTDLDRSVYYLLASD